MKKEIFVVAVAVVLISLAYFCFHPPVYLLNYYSPLGIGQGHVYDSVIQKKGNPLSVQQDNDGNWLVYYDGLKLRYGANIKNGAFECVTVTSNQHRFGIWKIGIGTPRKKIESVYKNIRKINDLPRDEFGIVDGDTWVLFKFDKNNNVSQIDITDGL